MSTFPKIRAAAGYAVARGHSDLARTRAIALLRRLSACEAVLAGIDGGMPAVRHGLLRGLVLAARDLAGPAWLTASSDDPDVAAFTALETTPAPPAPGELDEIISRVLWARFAPYGAARDDTRPGGEHGSGHSGPGRAQPPGRGQPDGAAGIPGASVGGVRLLPDAR